MPDRAIRIYQALLDESPNDAQTLAAGLGMPSADAIVILEQLARDGLAHRCSFGAHTYRAISPAIAMPDIIRRRRALLRQVEADVDQLVSDLTATPLTDIGELVIGERAVIDAVTQIQRAARTEVAMIDCPPYFPGGGQPNATEYDNLARGVAHRAIYHPVAVGGEANQQILKEYVAAGEQARVHARAWPKMTIVDSSVAIVVRSQTDPDPAQRILIRDCSLVDVLVAHYERLWATAIPVREPSENAEGPITERDRDILMLMAAGMKDRTIAHQLGIAERTVRRRISELMTELDADTRFRAGVVAAQRGWVACEGRLRR